MDFQAASRVLKFEKMVFTEFVELAKKHRAIDLSSGYPDFDGPSEALEAAYAAMRAGENQYAMLHGEPVLRHAIAAHNERFYGVYPDPETEITVTSGAAEAIHSIMDGLLNPGDEVIVFEPIYPYYPPNILMSGGVVRSIPLRPPHWNFDVDELAAAFNKKTRAIIVNTPHNPTGKIFSRVELQQIGELCAQWNTIAVTDEVYEHLVYDGAEHVRLADLPGMRERTLTISSYSKTFSATGWRIGWVIGPENLIQAVRLAHQYVADCSATPLQYGAAAALNLSDRYYLNLKETYEKKRDLLLQAVLTAGMKAERPAAGFFILAEIDHLGFSDDFAFCRHLIRAARISAIPPSAFYSTENRHLGKDYVRFAFCKTDDVLSEAGKRLIQARKDLKLA